MIIRTLALAAASLILLGSPLSAMTVANDHPGALPVLLGLDKVRAELKVNSLQKAVLDSLRDEYKASARQIFEPAPTTQAERAAAQEKLVKLNARYNQRALSVLNVSQRKRLLEIEKQALGTLALYTPQVQKTLGLTDAQKVQIEKLRVSGLASVGKINRKFEEGKIGYFERLQQLRQRKISQGEALLKILTPGQRSTLASLGGEPVSKA